MCKSMKAFSRGPQVINALYNYGPLNQKSLCELLIPNMTRRGISHCLQRLKKRNLVITCGKANTTYFDQFYQLSYSNEAKSVLAKILGIHENQINIPTFRGSEIEHSIVCAYWAEYFKRHYPNAQVTRDFHFKYDENIKNNLMAGQEMEMYPDLVISINNGDHSDSINIAVEIEKSLKSRNRIFNKLNKFSTRSHLDGIIYVCPDYALKDVIEGVFSERLKHNAIRIRQYGNYFLTFSDSFMPDFLESINLSSCSQKNINLSNWISILETIKWNDRTNSDFEGLASLRHTSNEATI